MNDFFEFYNNLSNLGSMSEELEQNITSSLEGIGTASASVEQAAKSVQDLAGQISAIIPDAAKAFKSLIAINAAQFVVILILAVMLFQVYKQIKRDK
ncbi:MAG: hypothetical protein II499_07035 [Firmicutes bacterium]|nr:hypothetical protein [Bacillota bacterium]